VAEAKPLPEAAQAATDAHKRRLGFEPIPSDLLLTVDLTPQPQRRAPQEDPGERWMRRWKSLGADDAAFKRVIDEMNAEVGKQQIGTPSGMAPTKD
jgi:hypothetical protein